MDFDDILIKTCDLLKNRPDVAQMEGKRISHLLVDEFQDVDPLQYEIIELLGVENVMVFGDPKQSIYSFRGADVELFNMVAKDKSYERRELDRNYRSTPKLVKFFNSATKNVFVEEAEGYETPYQELEADRSDFQSHICFDITIEDNEAELIAKRIESIAGNLDVLRDKSVEKAGYGDIAILVDSTTYMRELTRALIEHNIPYQVFSGSGFFEAPEVKALTNLLYALEDPYDDIALFGLLRSELFHLSDEEIYGMCNEKEETYLYDRLPAEVRGYLEKYLSLVDLIKPSELLSRIVRDRSYRAILAIGNRRDVSVKNVNKFISLVRSFESSGVRSMHTICEMLSRFTELKAREPEAGVSNSKENCVTIMTIHKAKGLEWPIVIVPYIYKRYRNNGKEVLIKKSRIGIRSNVEPFSAKRRESLIAIKLRDDERRRYEEERKRVLYVAMTRAKDHLFFTGCFPGHMGKCWATEIFDKSDTLKITQIARSMPMKKELHLAFDGGGLRPVYLNPPAEKLKIEREEKPEFMSYEPPEEKIVLDPSYAKVLLESPMKYYMKASGAGEEEINREADNRFYGSVIHRALELGFRADSRRIVEEIALAENVDIDDGVLEEGKKRIEDAKRIFERSQLKELIERATDEMQEVALFKDMGSFYIRGRADLVLFLDGKTMVVDYKTDADIGVRIDDYRIQLSLYSLCFDNPELYIYSVREGKLIPIQTTPPMEEIERRIEELRDRVL